ncbi:bifunctional UDP-sugar hydrolase/5'-nucleotidase [Bacteroides sp. 224]|uniref:bifunctional metallophosphatase/5'-nucleotidase n=1 Tax=Bacteroides sp. 224 TaxID=2302936 RepID=UPI0013D1CC5A|nr:metallophosphatase [Bacteroides sp. 224]NDV64042.1 bifunctional metallophosphatase/5'-nucleotidase [Bacteroides sp. 224]
MKQPIITFKSFTLFLFLCLATSMAAQKKLTIYHTNDIHSRIEPVQDKSADDVSAGKGGLIRVTGCVEQLRKKDPNLLLFDCGDFSQGTPYYNLFKGDVEIQLMNAAGYNAGTIGNHEFDFGMDNLARLVKMANFPIVCANYDFKGTVLEGLVKPYIILKKNGLKIGVFGLGSRLDGLVQASNCEGVIFHEPYDIANKIAALLKKKGCNIVICLSHLGLQGSPKESVCDIELIQQTRNIDLVLGGHSHTLMQSPQVYQNLDGKDVYVNQVGKSGIYLGKMDITFK